MPRIAVEKMPPWIAKADPHTHLPTIQAVADRSKLMLSQPIDEYDRSEIGSMFREIYVMIAAIAGSLAQAGEDGKR